MKSKSMLSLFSLMMRIKSQNLGPSPKTGAEAAKPGAKRSLQRPYLTMVACLAIYATSWI